VQNATLLTQLPVWAVFPNLKTLFLKMPFLEILPNELTSLKKLELLTLDCSRLKAPYQVIGAMTFTELVMRTATADYAVKDGSRVDVLHAVAMYDFLSKPHTTELVRAKYVLFADMCVQIKMHCMRPHAVEPGLWFDNI
jgi:hypothetical protein